MSSSLRALEVCDLQMLLRHKFMLRVPNLGIFDFRSLIMCNLPAILIGISRGDITSCGNN